MLQEHSKLVQVLVTQYCDFQFQYSLQTARCGALQMGIRQKHDAYADRLTVHLHGRLQLDCLQMPAIVLYAVTLLCIIPACKATAALSADAYLCAGCVDFAMHHTCMESSSCFASTCLRRRS